MRSGTREGITCIVIRSQRDMVVHERMQRHPLVSEYKPQVAARLLEPLHEPHDVLQAFVLHSDKNSYTHTLHTLLCSSV